MQQVDQLERDRQLLAEVEPRGLAAKLPVYIKLSGPGWLQSALTLGGGSLSSSLYLGVLTGFTMLWLQPVAMILGIIMLSAIGYVTMSTSERPLRAINQHVNPVLGWGWAIASLAANMVWCLPQYSLATGVVQQNLAPQLLGADGPLDPFAAKALIVGVVLLLTTTITWAYDSGSWGVKLYELILKLLVATIVVCFIGVVARMAMSEGLAWDRIAAGFIPDLSQILRPAVGFEPLLAEIPENWRPFWIDRIVSSQRDVAISAAATAVGINMTFLLPYSMLARGWGKEFRGLAKFDLGTGMLIPYILATTCVIIAAANQFHPGATGRTYADVDVAPLSEKERAAFKLARLEHVVGPVEMKRLEVAGEVEEHLGPLDPAEEELAAQLRTKDAFDLANSLAPLTGPFFANVLFGVGVLGMTLSTITLLMLISGFVICEMLGIPPKGWPHRLASLAAVTGVLGPFIWSDAAFYLAVPTSIFGMALLPIAYISFYLLMNQRSLLGAEMPRGGRRVAWNVLMGIATLVAFAASMLSIWSKVRWIGIAVVVVFLALALVVGMARRASKEPT